MNKMDDIAIRAALAALTVGERNVIKKAFVVQKKNENGSTSCEVYLELQRSTEERMMATVRVIIPAFVSFSSPQKIETIIISFSRDKQHLQTPYEERQVEVLCFPSGLI